MIPLYGFLEGDTLGLLVLAAESDTMRDLVAKLQQSARVRVRPLAHPCVIFGDRELALDTTVAQARMTPLDRFVVRSEPATAGVP